MGSYSLISEAWNEPRQHVQIIDENADLLNPVAVEQSYSKPRQDLLQQQDLQAKQQILRQQQDLVKDEAALFECQKRLKELEEHVKRLESVVESGSMEKDRVELTHSQSLLPSKNQFNDMLMYIATGVFLIFLLDGFSKITGRA